MAFTTIDNPELYFQTKLYTGNGGTNAITLDGSENMQPDWVWIKNRNGTQDHHLFDSVRGTLKRLESNSNTNEETRASSLTSYDSDGFTLGTYANTNTSSDTYVAWNWKAGTSFTNDASATGVGSLDSAGSINTTAGFSIIGYSGDTSDAPSTVAHGLSQKPEIMFIKRRTSTGQWVVYNKTIDATDNLHLDSDAARHDYLYYFQDTEPTSSVFTVGDDGETNKTGDTYINYIFHSVQGYSKIGSYIGNGSATDGTFVYTGMKPSFVLLKLASGTGSWCIYDNKRDTFNLASKRLVPNVNNAEADTSTQAIDFLSNGFKLKSNNTDQNGSGSTYIYLAFAESPFTNSSGVPNNAR